MTDPNGAPGIQPEQELSRAQELRAAAPRVRGLGEREREVLSVLRSLGSANVQQVAGLLSTSLAYTTVMTTLDRLYKKGLLRRVKKDRAFVYSTTLSAREVERQRAADLIQRFFSDSGERREILVSCLVDAVHYYDKGLLDRLEYEIRLARTQAVGRDEKPTGESGEEGVH